MADLTSPLRMPKSIAEIITSHRELSRWKRWVLMKLIPKDLWEYPPQMIAKMQEGAVIGNVTISYVSMEEPHA
jgi:hypothetical protein